MRFNTYVQEAGTGTKPTDPDPTYNENGSLKQDNCLHLRKKIIFPD